MKSVNESPSPGNIDTTQAPLMTLGKRSMDTAADQSSKISLGHQGVKNTGGNCNDRVLLCTNLDKEVDYEILYETMKTYGTIQRMKMKIQTNPISYNAYITFIDHDCAKSAHDNINGKKIGNTCCHAKLISSNNIQDEECDFIPPPTWSVDMLPQKTYRNEPIPTWHIVTYKDGRENFIRARESIQKKIGNIPHDNLKKYGKGLLIKAGNETQAALLTNYKVSTESNIKKISPHRSFNTLKGVIYSRDLFDFSDDEILDRCPPTVCKAQKLKGTNNAILVTFTCRYLPEILLMEHGHVKVKKFKSKPLQCFNCFEYGHSIKICQNDKKCNICSCHHKTNERCTEDEYCFNCKGSHFPNSRECPRYKFEQEVVEVANNEHVSFGSAKRLIMGANKDLSSTYASIIKDMNQPVTGTHENKTKSYNSFNSRGILNAKQPTSHVPSTSQSMNPNDVKPKQSKPFPEDIKKRVPDEMNFKNKTKSQRDVDSKSLPMEQDTNKSKNKCQKVDIIDETMTNRMTANKKCARVDNDPDDFTIPSKKKRAQKNSFGNIDEEIEISNPFSVFNKDQPVNENNERHPGFQAGRNNSEERDETVIKSCNKKERNFHSNKNESKYPLLSSQRKTTESSHLKTKKLTQNFNNQQSPVSSQDCMAVKPKD